MHETEPVSGVDVMHAAALVAAATVVATDSLPTVSEKVIDRPSAASRAAQIVTLAREIVEQWGRKA